MCCRCKDFFHSIFGRHAAVLLTFRLLWKIDLNWAVHVSNEKMSFFLRDGCEKRVEIVAMQSKQADCDDMIPMVRKKRRNVKDHHNVEGQLLGGFFGVTPLCGLLQLLGTLNIVNTPPTTEPPSAAPLLVGWAAPTTARSSTTATITTSTSTTGFTIDGGCTSPRSADRPVPVTSFLLRLNRDSQLTNVTADFDPHTTLSALVLRQTGDDCSLGRVKGIEFEESTGP